MGLTAEVVARTEEDTLVLEIRGAALKDGARGDVAGLVIGRKGATLDALQYLAAKVLGRHGAPGVRVVVDAEGYRERRREALVALAKEMAAHVLRTGEIEETDLLPAHERRIVHLACADIQGVTTRSEGDGDVKRLLVLPAGPSGEIDGNRGPRGGGSDPDDNFGNR
jgi:spoIIIJ-associated protein